MISPIFKRFCAVFMAILFAVFSVTFPITASAVVDPITASIVGISAAVAIPAILGGLGFFPTPDNSSVFDSLVTTIADALSPAWEVASTVGGTFLKMLSLNGNIYAQKELVQEILDLVFAEASVLTQYQFGSYTLSAFNDEMTEYYSSGFDTLVLGKSGGSYYLYLADTDSSYISSSGTITWVAPVSYRLYKTRFASDPWSFVSDFSLSTGSTSNSGVIWSNLSGDTFSVVQTATGITLGAVSADLADEAYRTWVQSPIIVVDIPSTSPDDPTDPSEDEDTDTDIAPTTPPGELETPGENNSKYLGLFKHTPDGVRWDEYIMAALAGQITGLGLQTMLQTREPQIQLQDQVDIIDTGNRVQIQTDSVPPDIDVSGGNDTDTDPDPTNPSDDPDGEPGSMVLDLSRFFPFCIPFDLYKLLSCLAAEPEAPKFVFGVPLPGGTIFTQEIDLSAWDDVAATIRKFELALFTVGLIVTTSKFIKW